MTNKPKYVYIIFRNGNEIDKASTLEEANYLIKEYSSIHKNDIFFISQRRIQK